MKTYVLSAMVTVSTYTKVRAESPEEALKKAEDRSVELCFNGSGTAPERNWCIESGDGVPQGIDVCEVPDDEFDEDEGEDEGEDEDYDEDDE